MTQSWQKKKNEKLVLKWLCLSNQALLIKWNSKLSVAATDPASVVIYHKKEKKTKKNTQSTHTTDYLLMDLNV